MSFSVGLHLIFLRQNILLNLVLTDPASLVDWSSLGILSLSACQKLQLCASVFDFWCRYWDSEQGSLLGQQFFGNWVISQILNVFLRLKGRWLLDVQLTTSNGFLCHWADLYPITFVMCSLLFLASLTQHAALKIQPPHWIC